MFPSPVTAGVVVIVGSYYALKFMAKGLRSLGRYFFKPKFDSNIILTCVGVEINGKLISGKRLRKMKMEILEAQIVSLKDVFLSLKKFNYS